MKKNTILLFSFLLLFTGLYSCESAPAPDSPTTDTPTEAPADDAQTDNPPASTFNYTIAAKQAGDFNVGSPIIAVAEEKGYVVEKRSISREGEEEPIYMIAGDGVPLLQIQPRYNVETQDYEDAVGVITIVSDRYKMANGLGIGSTIEAFQGAYTDAKFWHSNIGQFYVMETSQLPVQFLLNPSDYSNVEKKMTGAHTDLSASDFKAGSKVSSIRIF